MPANLAVEVQQSIEAGGEAGTCHSIAALDGRHQAVAATLHQAPDQRTQLDPALVEGAEGGKRLGRTSRQNRIVVCNAPIVEGAVMAATESSGGAALEDVKRTAEELSPVVSGGRSFSNITSPWETTMI